MHIWTRNVCRNLEVICMRLFELQSINCLYPLSSLFLTRYEADGSHLRMEQYMDT